MIDYVGLREWLRVLLFTLEYLKNTLLTSIIQYQDLGGSLSYFLFIAVIFLNTNQITESGNYRTYWIRRKLYLVPDNEATSGLNRIRIHTKITFHLLTITTSPEFSPLRRWALIISLIQYTLA